MDRKAYQGESVDEVWLDEDSRGRHCVRRGFGAPDRHPRPACVFGNPTLGVTPIRKRFKERLAGHG
jgi:hypothetical protein